MKDWPTTGEAGFSVRPYAADESVDDALVHLHLALIALSDFPGGLQKYARERLHDVGLVHDGHFPAPVPDRVIEGELGDPPGTRASIDPGTDGYRVRVPVDGNIANKLFL